MNVDQFAKLCRFIGEFDLVSASSGNFSFRFEDRILITASNSWLKITGNHQVSVCDFEGNIIEGAKPSSEIFMHLEIMKSRPDINFVFHFQSDYATAIACRQDIEEINFNIIPEIPYYIKNIGVVDYIKPGTIELAKECAEKIKDNNLLILKNHGQVTIGKDGEEALKRAIFFELACKIICTNRGKVNTISTTY